MGKEDGGRPAEWGGTSGGAAVQERTAVGKRAKGFTVFR
jgi:hypothetical protein